MNLTTLITKKVRLVGLILIVFIGAWMMVTPFYSYLVETLDIGPVISVIIGAAIVFIGVTKYKLHLW